MNIFHRLFKSNRTNTNADVKIGTKDPDILTEIAVCPDREHMCQPLSLNRIISDRKLYTDKPIGDIRIYEDTVVDYEYDAETKIFHPIFESYDQTGYKIYTDSEVSELIYPNQRFWLVRFSGEKRVFQIYSQDWFFLADDVEQYLRVDNRR